MDEYLAKYKWYILGYILYLSIVMIFNIDEDNWVNIQGIIAFGITIPLVLLFGIFAINYQISKGRWPSIRGKIIRLIKFCKRNKNDEVVKLTKEVTKKHLLFDDIVSKKIIVYDTFSGVWPFVEFLTIYGPKIELAYHKNTRTKNTFCTIDITNNVGQKVSIRFHSTLGELAVSRIKERKNELWVVQRKDNNLYYLIDNQYEEWYDFLL